MSNNSKFDNKLQLEIYISECCFFCVDTEKEVEKLKKMFPKLAIRIIDIENKTENIPDEVFSVPTYRFKGKTISLGNPTNEFYSKLQKLIENS